MRSPREFGAAAVVVVVTLLVATALLLGFRHVVGLEAENEVDVLAAESVTEVSAVISVQMSAAALAASSSGQPARASREAIPTALAVRVLARDSGEPVLDDASGGLVVVARYGTTPIPATVEARRDAVQGYLVMPLDLDTTLARLAPPDHQIAVDGPGERVASTSSTVAGAAVTSTASFAPDVTSDWSVTVSGPAGRPSVVAWAAILVVLLTGAAAAGAIAVRQRASRLRRAELEGLQETSAVVARLSVLARQSRDLGEVLPSLTTELAATLGLHGLTLTTSTPGGDRPVFGWGVPPAGGESAAGLHEVAPGQTVWLRLTRGGRTAARLWVVAGRQLSHHDINTLVAVAELMASALANSDAFAQQESLLKRVQAVDQLKSVFLSTASHELRTPVVAIAGYASVLNDSWDDLGPEQARSLVMRVDRNAQRLSQMVEDLLDFSRLERNEGLVEEHAALDLGEVVGQVLAEQPDLVQDHDVTAHLEDGLIVTGSHQALERVVTNLVGNATKYSPPGTRIRVLVHQRDAAAELVVEDDGPGILEADRERIFSRFYRGQGDEVTRTRGTGLGLAIVTEFAATMGGAIRLEECTGNGARFVVSFPLASPAPDLEPAATEPASTVPTPGGPP